MEALYESRKLGLKSLNVTSRRLFSLVGSGQPSMVLEQASDLVRFLLEEFATPIGQ